MKTRYNAPPIAGEMTHVILSRTCTVCTGEAISKYGLPCRRCSGTGVECWACPIEEFMQLIAQRFSIRYPVMPPKEA